MKAAKNYRTKQKHSVTCSHLQSLRHFSASDCISQELDLYHLPTEILYFIGIATVYLAELAALTVKQYQMENKNCNLHTDLANMEKKKSIFAS